MYDIGRLAQLVERLPYKQDVTGSSPVLPICCFTATNDLLVGTGFLPRVFALPNCKAFNYTKCCQENCMFGLGWPEVAIIGLIALVIFGPKKIPEMGSALGKTLRGFKDEMNKPTSEQNDTEQDNS